MGEKKRLIFLGLLLLGINLSGCQPAADIPGFDEEAFREDAGGCEGVRNGMKEEVFEIEDDLQGLGQQEVMQLLGKPDKHSLASRGKKTFIYYIGPSAECDDHSSAKPLTMLIQFSALDAVTAVSFENY